MSWLKEVIGTEKAIIGMCHFRALPGDPGFDRGKGMDYVVGEARRDMTALQDGGVDAVMFSNEFSLPYLTDVPKETVAAMSRVIGQLLPEIKVPFGVNALWDGAASIDIAAATGAKFVREIFSGVYASDFGLWNTNYGAIARHRESVAAGDVKLLFNIVPEAAKYLAERNIMEIAMTTVFNCKCDALCVSGLTAGAAVDGGVLAKVREAAPGVVLLANTGCRIGTIADILAVADGAVVGTEFKEGGIFENPVSAERVKRFMERVYSVR
ncbi:MAG: BtpA/SgcQ family protein [Synergistaceae bacterium]|jgi:membrane complex biogenesis BtpA family protein|nr:BtpA/SgcQ family protein [Synergistaceae bacterium]